MLNQSGLSFELRKYTISCCLQHWKKVRNKLQKVCGLDNYDVYWEESLLISTFSFLSLIPSIQGDSAPSCLPWHFPVCWWRCLGLVCFCFKRQEVFPSLVLCDKNLACPVQYFFICFKIPHLLFLCIAHILELIQALEMEENKHFAPQSLYSLTA